MGSGASRADGAAQPSAQTEAAPLALTLDDSDAAFRPIATAHRTDAFSESATLVVRRAQVVRLQATCAVAKGAKVEWRATAVSLTGAEGAQSFKLPPVAAKAVGKSEQTGAWGVVVTAAKKQPDRWDVCLCVPPTAPVGRYEFLLKARVNGGRSVRSQAVRAIVLLNPFQEADVCHMERGLLDEYLLNEAGKVYTGVDIYVKERPWRYDQFDPTVTAVVLDMLLPQVAPL
jgi:hypothetical protein